MSSTLAGGWDRSRHPSRPIDFEIWEAVRERRKHSGQFKHRPYKELREDQQQERRTLLARLREAGRLVSPWKYIPTQAKVKNTVVKVRTIISKKEVALQYVAPQDLSTELLKVIVESLEKDPRCVYAPPLARKQLARDGLGHNGHRTPQPKDQGPNTGPSSTNTDWPCRPTPAASKDLNNASSSLERSGLTGSATHSTSHNTATVGSTPRSASPAGPLPSGKRQSQETDGTGAPAAEPIHASTVPATTRNMSGVTSLARPERRRTPGSSHAGSAAQSTTMDGSKTQRAPSPSKSILTKSKRPDVNIFMPPQRKRRQTMVQRQGLPTPRKVLSEDVAQLNLHAPSIPSPALTTMPSPPCPLAQVTPSTSAPTGPTASRNQQVA